MLPLLQRELHTSRGAVALYPSAFAVGLVAIGIAAPSLAGPGRRHAAFSLALLGLGGGASLLSSAVAPQISLLGALAMGLGAALIVALVPALGTDMRGAGAAGLLSRANALSSAAGLLAPLLIAGAITVGAGWQTGYLMLPLVAVCFLLIALHRRELPDARAARAGDHAEPSGSASTSRRGGLQLWISLVLAVSVEFCMVFWASSYLREGLGLRTATADALAGAFLAGMACGRACVAPVTRLTRTVDATILLVIALALTGFGVIWLARDPWLATLGLGCTGLGVALLYPLTVARYVATAAGGSTHASARAALASGIAIGVAPFALATISDVVGLRLAYLMVPVLCFLLIANTQLAARPAIVA